MLLVAISTVGGSSAFMFSNGAISDSQVSGSNVVELIHFEGYDARDVEKLVLHDGNEILSKNCCGVVDGIKSQDERITVFIENNSVLPVSISEVRLAGNVYSYSPSSKIGEWNKIGNGHAPNIGEYTIVKSHLGGKNYEVLEESFPVIEPGELVTILMDLDQSIPLYRGAQIMVTTLNGNVFASTIVIGQDV